MTEEELQEAIGKQVAAAVAAGLKPVTDELQSLRAAQPAAPNIAEQLGELIKAQKPAEKTAIEKLLENPEEPTNNETLAHVLTESLNAQTQTVLAAIKQSQQETTQQRAEIAVKSSPNYRALLQNPKYKEIRENRFDPLFSMTIKEMEERAESSKDPDEMENFAELVMQAHDLDMPVQKPRGRAASKHAAEDYEEHDDERTQLESKLADLHERAKVAIRKKDPKRKEILKEIELIDDQLNGSSLGKVA